MDGKTKSMLQAIGAKFREERRSNATSTPRSEQSVKQLAATWKNSSCKPATRVDAFQHWYAKENEGELKTPSEVIIVLEAYDHAPLSV
jgi:hypothetical protein